MLVRCFLNVAVYFVRTKTHTEIVETVKAIELIRRIIDQTQLPIAALDIIKIVARL